LIPVRARESGGEKANLYLSGTVSARSIGVNIPITQSAAAADHWTVQRCPESCNRAKKPGRLLGLRFSKNTLET
jgi:hypothetical protein